MLHLRSTPHTEPATKTRVVVVAPALPPTRHLPQSETSEEARVRTDVAATLCPPPLFTHAQAPRTPLHYATPGAAPAGCVLWSFGEHGGQGGKKLQVCRATPRCRSPPPLRPPSWCSGLPLELGAASKQPLPLSPLPLWSGPFLRLSWLASCLDLAPCTGAVQNVMSTRTATDLPLEFGLCAWRRRRTGLTAHCLVVVEATSVGAAGQGGGELQRRLVHFRFPQGRFGQSLQTCVPREPRHTPFLNPFSRPASPSICSYVWSCVPPLSFPLSACRGGLPAEATGPRRGRPITHPPMGRPPSHTA